MGVGGRDGKWLLILIFGLYVLWYTGIQANIVPLVKVGVVRGYIGEIVWDCVRLYEIV